MPDSPPRRPIPRSCRDSDGAVAIDLDIAADLPWFQGHFPDFPILPGIVQLDWALDFAREHLPLPPAPPRSFQVKFKSAILPGDQVRLTLSWAPDKNRLGFEYRRGDGICSSGLLTLAVES